MWWLGAARRMAAQGASFMNLSTPSCDPDNGTRADVGCSWRSSGPTQSRCITCTPPSMAGGDLDGFGDSGDKDRNMWCYSLSGGDLNRKTSGGKLETGPVHLTDAVNRIDLSQEGIHTKRQSGGGEGQENTHRTHKHTETRPVKSKANLVILI